MGIIVKNIPVKTHHSIRLIKRYHRPLLQIYNIITVKFPEIKPKLTLQISFKALNDLIGPNNLVLTLLVFGAYPCMIDIDAPLRTITQRNIAMRKAIEEVKRSHTSCQLNDVLNT